MGRVIGIVGDADIYCIPCAKWQYGIARVNAVVRGVWRGRRVNAAEGIGPKDREGNVLGVILSGTDDADEQYCCECREKLG